MGQNSGYGVVVDVTRLNQLLVEGHQIAVKRDGERIVRCYIVGTQESVPELLFEQHLANGWIEDVARGIRFAISAQGRQALE